MKFNMNEWAGSLPKNKKPIPLLSFPAAQLLGVNVYDFTHDADIQIRGIVEVARRLDSAAAVCMMDLSVEAEAFGCEIKATENEVPTVLGVLISDEEEAKALKVPKVGEGRTGLYIKAAKGAKENIFDRPVLAGIIGPFSLAGRLMDVSEALMNCITDEDFVHAALRKTTDFLIEYAKAYKEAGVDGIVMAEPLSGLLSASLEEEFSAPYVKEIIDSVQDEGFIVIYHNCGPNTLYMTESFCSNGAGAYHFGDAINLKDMLDKMPKDKIICGNISPSEEFLNGTKESMYDATKKLVSECGAFDNFVLSSGCDIPPEAKWDNIYAFFDSAKENWK